MIRKKLDEYLNHSAEQFGRRRLRRSSLAWYLVHNAEFLVMRANSGLLSKKQREEYEYMLRGLWTLLPLIRKAWIKLPGALKDDIEKYGPRNTA